MKFIKVMDSLSARVNMIEGQIIPNGVVSQLILNAFKLVPREIFTPQQYKNTAYLDEFITLNEGRFLMPSMLIAKLISVAGIKPTDKILVIACSNGYIPALLSYMADQITGLESETFLEENAQINLERLSITKCTITTGDLQLGCREYAPFDKIIIPGKIARLPHNLINQLEYKGKIITIMDDSHSNMGYITKFTKVTDIYGDSKLEKKRYDQCNCYELREFGLSKEFSL